MELECIIAGVSQDLSFGENVTATFLHIRLPDGQQIRASIDDTAAASVVALSVAQNGQPKSAPRSALPAAPLPTVAVAKQATSSSRDVEPDIEPVANGVPAKEWLPETNGIAKAPSIPFGEDEEGPRIFGGQDEETAPTQAYPSGPVQKGPTPVPGSNVQRTASGKIVVPSKTVPKSAWGYPMTNAGGIDTESITTDRDKNDDGVGSV